jgi:prefoldin subunit 5
MDLYYILLGIAAVISALNSGRNSKALEAAIKELQRTLQSHDDRITQLEKRPVGFTSERR